MPVRLIWPQFLTLHLTLLGFFATTKFRVRGPSPDRVFTTEITAMGLLRRLSVVRLDDSNDSTAEQVNYKTNKGKME